jgi:nitrous oxidase accessory protein NosD
VRRLLVIAIASAACFAVVHVGVAYAAACGTVNSSTTLSSDCAAPLIVGASGITVDLGGHAVLCSGAPGETGIDVGDRSNVLIRNGSVNGCEEGVLADGGDSNQYRGLTLTNNTVGLEISHSASSAIRRNTVTNNSDFAGVLLFETTGSVVQRNTVSNSGFGIFDNGGTSSVISRNTTSSGRGPANVGILIEAQSDIVMRNTIFGNGTGLLVSGVFPIHGNNRLMLNTSTKNGLDMKDDFPGCDSNIWKANTFMTANQGCIH